MAGSKGVSKLSDSLGRGRGGSLAQGCFGICGKGVGVCYRERSFRSFLGILEASLFTSKLRSFEVCAVVRSYKVKDISLSLLSSYFSQLIRFDGDFARYKA